MTEKIWISTETSHIFGLWLQSKMDLFRGLHFPRKFYKDAFNSLEQNWISGDADIAYNLFVDDLCNNI